MTNTTIRGGDTIVALYGYTKRKQGSQGDVKLLCSASFSLFVLDVNGCIIMPTFKTHAWSSKQHLCRGVTKYHKLTCKLTGIFFSQKRELLERPGMSRSPLRMPEPFLNYVSLCPISNTNTTGWVYLSLWVGIPGRSNNSLFQEKKIPVNLQVSLWYFVTPLQRCCLELQA